MSGCRDHLPQEGGGSVTVYEALMFAISFAGLMVTIISTVVSIVVILSHRNKK
ncbi:MAG: putative holin-like toxin [Sporolactobacillus sp.]